MPKENQGQITASVDEIKYQNIAYDFSEAIAEQKKTHPIVPPAADIAIEAADEKGATGVILVPAQDAGNTTDYYLNALVAGNKIIISAKDGAQIASAASSAQGELAIEDGKVAFVPKTMDLRGPADEVVDVKMADGAAYKIHTVPDNFPSYEITGCGVAPENAGVYSLYSLGYLISVDTDGMIVYYRSTKCSGYTDNFEPHMTPEGLYHSYWIGLTAQHFGLGEGMFVIMDADYRDIDVVTMVPNDDPNHTHGEAYLDFHEIRVIGRDNYLAKGYNRLHAQVPESCEGIDGTQDAWVWAITIQQIKNGKPVFELNSTDYPILFEASVETCDYAATSQEKPSDYMHMNSLDWISDADGNLTKVLTSIRSLSALIQFDVATGKIDWIFGGKASTLKGFDEHCTPRQDLWGNEFPAVMFGQHYARYNNRNADGTMPEGELPLISVFDNVTGSFPFKTDSEIPTLTRVFRFVLDEAAGTATVQDIITAEHMQELSPEKYHFGDHCGSVDYFNENSVCIGWGLDMICATTNRENATYDSNYPDLPLYCATHAVMSDYDMANDKICFEISLVGNGEPTMDNIYFSYRTYKVPTAR